MSAMDDELMCVWMARRTTVTFNGVSLCAGCEEVLVEDGTMCAGCHRIDEELEARRLAVADARAQAVAPPAQPRVQMGVVPMVRPPAVRAVGMLVLGVLAVLACMVGACAWVTQ